MSILASKFKKGLNNLGIDISSVVKMKRGKANPNNPGLSVLYFLGKDEIKKEKIVRTWFYSSEENREKELRLIRDKYPHLPVV